MHKTEEIISEAVQGEQEVSIEKKANSLSFRQQIQEKIMEEIGQNSHSLLNKTYFNFPPK